MKTLLLFLCSFWALGVSQDVEPDVNMDLLTMGPCDGFENLRMHYGDDMTLQRVGQNKFHLNGQFIITDGEPIAAPIEVSMTVYKCEQQAFETCEEYVKWGPEEGCAQVEAKKGSMYDVIKQAGKEDECKCPLKPQTLNVVNYEIEIPSEAATTASTLSRFWLVVVEGYSNEVALMCNEMYLEAYKNGPLG